MQPITEALSHTHLGAPLQFRNPTLFPLPIAEEKTPSYVTLDEALARKTARVTEVSESGSVPELLFVNEGDAPVLRLDKLLRSYAMDAIEAPASDAKPPALVEARKFLDEMMSVAAERFPAIGEGEDLRIESDAMAGGALLLAGRVVHVCTFRVEGDGCPATPGAGIGDR